MVAGSLHTGHRLSVRRACQAVGLSRAAFDLQGSGGSQRDGPVIEALNAVVAANSRWGFWKCFDRLRFCGHGWNHKRVHRVYCTLKLNLPRRAKRRLIRPAQPLLAPAGPNEIWSLDFMSDSLYSGRRFRTLNVLDEGVREALAIEIDTSLPASRVVRTLERLREWRGLPQAIRLDNGPELISQVMTGRCEQHRIELRYIQPGKPDQNAFIERFNRTYREEVLNAWVFDSLNEVREITEAWIRQYNEERPHDALGSLPPTVFRERLLAGHNSTSKTST